MTDHVLLTSALRGSGLKAEAPASNAQLMTVAGELIKSLNVLEARIAALEKQAESQSKMLDHLDSHALRFGGEWQSGSPFYAASLVSHQGGLYVALRDSEGNRHIPPHRAGAPWAKLI